MKHIFVLAASTMILTLSTPVMASSYKVGCGTVKGAWMSTNAVKARAAGLGYSVRRVKREHGCYEVYAINKKGARVEIYMNPVTGKIVKIKKKS